MHLLDLGALGGDVRRAAATQQQILDRAQQQGQRGAEFVARIGKEYSLGSVDFGQCLGPPPLFLIGAGAADRGGDLGRDQHQEIAVLLVQTQPRADPGHQDASELFRLGRPQRNKHGGVRRVRPRTARNGIETICKVVDDKHRRTADGLGQRPARGAFGRIAKVNRDRAEIEAGGGPGSARQAGVAIIRIDQVDECERYVLVVGAERPGGNLAGLLGGLGLPGPRAEVAQGGEAALADDLFGNLVHRRQHPADAARRGVVGNRAVGDGEMGLLDEPVPVDLQQDVIHPGRRAAVERGVDQRLQDVPDLRPALLDRLRQGFGMLFSEDRTIGVIVHRNVLRSPPEQQRKPIGEQQTGHHPQARRPVLDRSDRRTRPIVSTHQRAHLAAPGQ